MRTVICKRCERWCFIPRRHQDTISVASALVRATCRHSRGQTLGPIFSKDLANQCFQFSKWFTVSCHANEVSHNRTAVRQMNVFVNECCLSADALRKTPSHNKNVWFQWENVHLKNVCHYACQCVFMCVCVGEGVIVVLNGEWEFYIVTNFPSDTLFHLIQHLNFVCTTWYHIKQVISTQSSE